MNSIAEWLNQGSVLWWNYIVHTTWQAAVVGAVLLVLVHSFGRRWPAPLRYALLVLALLKFACPPLLPVPTGIFTRFISPRIILAGMPERKPSAGDASQSEAAKANPETGHGLMARPAPSTLGFPSIHWTTLLMLLHGLGAGLIVLSLRKEASKLRSLADSSRLLRGGRIPRQYRDLSIQLGLYRIPNLIVSRKVPGPIAFGVQKPSILLPVKILGRLPLTDLKAVLAHELAHCQRGDLWLNWVQLILLAVWWFHPVLWLVNRSLRDVREDCCDDLLLAKGIVSNDAYCDVLLRTASEITPALPLSAALGFGAAMHPLGRRLARITDWTLKRTDRVSLTGATAVLITAALVLPGVRSRELPGTPDQGALLSNSGVTEDTLSAKQQKTATIEFPRRDPTLPNVANGLPDRGAIGIVKPMLRERVAPYREVETSGASFAQLLGVTPAIPTQPIPIPQEKSADLRGEPTSVLDRIPTSVVTAGTFNAGLAVSRIVMSPNPSPVYRMNNSLWARSASSSQATSGKWNRPAFGQSRPERPMPRTDHRGIPRGNKSIAPDTGRPGSAL